MTDEDLARAIRRAIGKAVARPDDQAYPAAWAVLYGRGQMLGHTRAWLAEQGVPTAAIAEAERVGIEAYYRAIGWSPSERWSGAVDDK